MPRTLLLEDDDMHRPLPARPLPLPGLDAAHAAARAHRLLPPPTSAKDPDTKTPAVVPPPAGPPRPTGQRILVVEDNEANRDMLRRRLVVHGYAVTGAGDGREALDLLRAE